MDRFPTLSVQQTEYFLYTLISKLVYTKPSFIADDVDHIATNPLSIEFDKKCLYCIFLV